MKPKDDKEKISKVINKQYVKMRNSCSFMLSCTNLIIFISL